MCTCFYVHIQVRLFPGLRPVCAARMGAKFFRNLRKAGHVSASRMEDLSKHSQSHIDSIVKQEEEALERRSFPERLADAVGGFAGSLTFVAAQSGFLVVWLLVNSGRVPAIRPFDPYPFQFLGVLVAMEAVILSSFILMRQNRMMRRGERRNHLNLQVDLLAEKEITKLLQMVRAICAHMGLRNLATDKEIRELSRPTSIESLSKSLDDQLPGS